MHTAAIGSRRKVWNGTAHHTPGGLVKSDLMMNKYRRIVSRKKHKMMRSKTRRAH